MLDCLLLEVCQALTNQWIKELDLFLCLVKFKSCSICWHPNLRLLRGYCVYALQQPEGMYCLDGLEIVW